MKKKRFVLEATIDEDKTLKLAMNADEFSNLELLGVLERAKADIVERIEPRQVLH